MLATPTTFPSLTRRVKPRNNMRTLYSKQVELTKTIMDQRSPRAKVDTPRSPGLHVQAINRELAIAAGKLDDGPSVFGDFDGETYPLLPAVGVAWEEFRASTYQPHELLWQPYELHRDGIYGTPDGIYTGYHDLTIWECKFSTKKIQPIEQMWLYCKQGMAYCAQQGCNHVLYDVCWMMGDYTRPYNPILTTTLIEFSDSEIEAWWSIMLKTAKTMNKGGH